MFVYISLGNSGVKLCDKWKCLPTPPFLVNYYISIKPFASLKLPCHIGQNMYNLFNIAYSIHTVYINIICNVKVLNDIHFFHIMISSSKQPHENEGLEVLCWR